MSAHCFRLPSLPVALLALVLPYLHACTDSSSGSEQQSLPAAITSPFVSAHRGGAAYAPENTMLAFANAVRLGVDELETDAQLSADGVLVLIHDDTLDRTSDCSGPVNAMSLAQLKDCDAAYWFSPGQAVTRKDESAEHPLRGQGISIPTAEDMFAWIASMGEQAPQISIEIKNVPGENNFDPLGQTAASVLVPLIQAYGLSEQVVVQSFFPTSLTAVRLRDPSIRTLLLTTSDLGTTALANLALTVAGGYAVSAPNHDAFDMNAAYVAAAHAAGKQVVNWTADRADDIQRLVDLGVDGVMSNYPACLLQLQNRLHASHVMTPQLSGAYPGKPCR